MRVIPPLTITSAMLTSSTVAEPSAGETAWSSGATYAVGDVVISATTHRKYQCIQAHSTPAKDPTSAANAAWWTDIGPTNRWAMFDLLRNTGTSGASPITAVLTPGERVDALALIGLDADTVSFSVSVSGSPVYSYTASLSTRDAFDWYDYFFLPFSSRSAIALFDLPPYVSGVITITITKATGNPSCGGVVIGRSVYLGETSAGAEVDALNFSKVDRDEFGTATLVQRRTVPKAVATTLLEKARVNVVSKLRDDLNAVPALWSGLDDQDSGYFEPLLILGFYKRFTINMDQPDYALLSMELEEV